MHCEYSFVRHSKNQACGVKVKSPSARSPGLGPELESGLETEWDYSGRQRMDGQKKKIGKAKERKEKIKGEKMK